MSKETTDVSIIATSSSLEKVVPLIKQAIVHGSNVISLCEELSYPYKNFPDLAEELDDLAINDVPNIHQKIIGGVHSDIGTAVMIVNLIPKVIDTPSGLLTMKVLSLPCYTANVWKR